jgi:hypothetical protein
VRFSSALLNHWRPLADEYIRSLQSTQSWKLYGGTWLHGF